VTVTRWATRPSRQKGAKHAHSQELITWGSCPEAFRPGAYAQEPGDGTDEAHRRPSLLGVTPRHEIFAGNPDRETSWSVLTESKDRR
jgi:hypothetical protein